MYEPPSPKRRTWWALGAVVAGGAGLVSYAVVGPGAHTAAADDVPTALASTVTRPPIISRARWGADESTVTGTAEYIDRISAVFVHDTGGTNSYSCAESPALIRALMAHDVRTAGRGDLGYNFVVDKCGRIYEGRAGGADLSVRGEHTPASTGTRRASRCSATSTAAAGRAGRPWSPWRGWRRGSWASTPVTRPAR